ncbi:hypothetical protein HX747_30935 [Streptomyces sp. L06]|nr:hypothetical protein [Streptomyces sp. L06]
MAGLMRTDGRAAGEWRADSTLAVELRACTARSTGWRTLRRGQGCTHDVQALGAILDARAMTRAGCGSGWADPARSRCWTAGAAGHIAHRDTATRVVHCTTRRAARRWPRPSGARDGAHGQGAADQEEADALRFLAAMNGEFAQIRGRSGVRRLSGAVLRGRAGFAARAHPVADSPEE